MLSWATKLHDCMLRVLSAVTFRLHDPCAKYFRGSNVAAQFLKAWRGGTRGEPANHVRRYDIREVFCVSTTGRRRKLGIVRHHIGKYARASPDAGEDQVEV